MKNCSFTAESGDEVTVCTKKADSDLSFNYRNHWYDACSREHQTGLIARCYARTAAKRDKKTAL